MRTVALELKDKIPKLCEDCGAPNRIGSDMASQLVTYACSKRCDLETKENVFAHDKNTSMSGGPDSETVKRIQATREAGKVRRCHVVPHFGQYNIAEHSYGALSLLLLLCEFPTLNLVRAVQWHDCAERWLGDLPSPAKAISPEFKEVYDKAEEDVLKRLGLLQKLDPVEKAWLRGVDTLDLWLWCREEFAMGNTAVEEMLVNCAVSLEAQRKSGELPFPIVVYVDKVLETQHKRLSDFFAKAFPDESRKTE